MDIKLFKNPPNIEKPMVRWYWPGLDVEEKELRQEIKDMHDIGIGGAELQPFMIGQPKGLRKSDPERFKRSHRFMHDYHYEMMKAVIDEAKSRGMFIDITGNSAWPAGGNHISVEKSLRTLLFGTAKVTGGSTFKGKVPKLKVPRQYFVMGTLFHKIMGSAAIEYIPDDKKLIKVLAGKVVGKSGKRAFTSWRVKESTLLQADSLIDLTDRVDAHGKLQWQAPEGDWQLFTIYQGTAGARPLVSATSDIDKKPLVVDHFDADAVKFHFDAFIGKAKEWFGDEFGQTFRAVFTDSIELVTPMHWTDSFAEEFTEHRGYDITPYLPICHIPSKDNGFYTYGNEVGLPNFDINSEDGQRIRYDFQRTLSELFIENYVQTVGQWCSDHALLSRMQGYGMRADPLSMLGYSHIPETETFYSGCLNFFKLAGAAATLYQRPVATCEALCWPDRVYMMTPLKWRVTMDRLFESGINQIIYAGYGYDHPAFGYAGYYPFSSPNMAMTFSADMSERNKLLHESAPTMNGYAARIQHVMQKSKTKASVAIFYPIFDYPNGYYVKEEMVQGYLDDKDEPLVKQAAFMEMASPTGTEVTGERKWIQDTAKLGSELVANGYYYMYLNEDRLIKVSNVKDGKLLIGEAEFEVLILYREEALPLDVAKKLAEIAQQGIPVLCYGCKPGTVPSYYNYQQQEQELKLIMDDMNAPVLAQHKGVLDALSKLEVNKEIIYHAPMQAVGFIHKKDRQEDVDYYFIRNYTRKDKTLRTIPIQHKVPLLLDAWTGDAGKLKNYQTDQTGLRLAIKLPEFSSCLIALVEQDKAKDYVVADFEILKEETNLIREISNFTIRAEERAIDGSYVSVEASVTRPKDLRKIQGFGHVSAPCEYTTSFVLDG